jgi:hypothetical protein
MRGRSQPVYLITGTLLGKPPRAGKKPERRTRLSVLAGSTPARGEEAPSADLSLELTAGSPLHAGKNRHCQHRWHRWRGSTTAHREEAVTIFPAPPKWREHPSVLGRSLKALGAFASVRGAPLHTGKKRGLPEHAAGPDRNTTAPREEASP